jgi:hypothetical protein
MGMTHDRIEQAARFVSCSHCNGLGLAPDSHGLGRRHRAMRVARGASLRSYAATLGISAAYLCDLESGRRAWNGLAAKEAWARLLDWEIALSGSVGPKP